MEARVGARIEVETPRPWLTAADVGLLLALVAVSVALHAWLVGRTVVTARDGIGFARYALHLESPDTAPVSANTDGRARTFIDVLRAAEHPPGYPATVLAVSYAVRPIHPAPLPDQMLLSCRVAAAVAGVLLVVPTFLLGRSLLGRFPGFAAALLFQVLPVPAHVTSDGLAEALYLLCVSTSLLFGTRALRHRSTLYFILSGMAAGASYLVRPEGLMVVLAVGVVAAGLGAFRRWPRDVAAGRLVALGVGVLLVAVPYMMVIGKVSQKPSVNEFIQRVQGLNPKAKLGTWDNGDARPARAGALFAAWYDADTDGDKLGWAAKATAGEVWKASHYAPLVLAVVGLVMLRKRLLSDPGLMALPVLAAVNLAAVYAFGLKIGYVSERHTLLVVLILCYFAAAAIEPIARGVASGHRFGTAGLLLALVASALPAALRPLHENRVGHYHAGKFLETAATPADVVVDPFNWALFYSGRSLTHVPEDPAGARVLYAVWEVSKDNPHSRLPRRELALNVARDGWSEVVFHWPPDVPPAEAKVLVYKLDGGTQDTARAVGGGAITPYLTRYDPGIPRPR